MRQPQLIDARPFRTQKERLAYIRGKLDEIRAERVARRRLPARRPRQTPIAQPGLFQ